MNGSNNNNFSLFTNKTDTSHSETTNTSNKSNYKLFPQKPHNTDGFHYENAFKSTSSIETNSNDSEQSKPKTAKN